MSAAEMEDSEPRVALPICQECRRAMRPHDSHLAEYPDTVRFGARGLCDNDYRRERRGIITPRQPFRSPVEPETWSPAPVYVGIRALRTPVDPERWQEWAACQETDPEVFFPEKGGSVGPAKRICAGCPASVFCLEAGLHERYGVWGGVVERDRRQLVAQEKWSSGQIPGAVRQ